MKTNIKVEFEIDFEEIELTHLDAIIKIASDIIESGAESYNTNISILKIKGEQE